MSDRRSGAAPLLGYAALWAEQPEKTWSGTSWSLMQALRDHTDVVDLGVHPSRARRSVAKARYLGRHGGRFVTTYRHEPAWKAWVERSVQASVRAHPVDAVVEIGDLASVERPYFLYQDLSYDSVLDAFDDETGGTPHFPGVSRDDLLRNRDRQHRLYRSAAGVMTMSRWLADRLVTEGVPAEKVHVVPPGIEMPPAPLDGGASVPEAPRRRLLFVGRDFHTKAGDVVVAAFQHLRATHDPGLTLTVAGPVAWPLPGDVPDGVTWLGAVSGERVAELFRTHDLLVMPSRLEGFGKVFAEARCAGLPAIGRMAYAMPELITPGSTGALVDGDDVDDLAAAIVSVLADDQLYERCRAGRADAIRYFSWDRAAVDVLAVVRRGLAART